MLLRSLYLENFRNYREAYFEFHPKLNLISGSNAQGKTTVLEAIYYLMLGRSFRTLQHEDLIRKSSTSFFLETSFCQHFIDQKLCIGMENKERKILHNSTLLKNSSSLLGLVQGVIMTPDDVNLIKGSPLARRQFMDFHIAQADPLYVHHSARYARSMRQRNQLLKQKNLTTIESWEYAMAHSGAYLMIKRKRYIESLLTPSQEIYSYLTGEKEHLTLSYQAAVPLLSDENEAKNLLLERFKKNRSREVVVGYTLIGPQKDDLWIGIGDQEARFFGSEGQQRSLVTALQIGSWHQLKKMTEINPLLMIDDFGIGLDQHRKEKLLNRLEDFGQVFLTSTEDNLLDKSTFSKLLHKVPLT